MELINLTLMLWFLTTLHTAMLSSDTTDVTEKQVIPVSDTNSDSKSKFPVGIGDLGTLLDADNQSTTDLLRSTISSFSGTSSDSQNEVPVIRKLETTVDEYDHSTTDLMSTTDSSFSGTSSDSQNEVPVLRKLETTVDEYDHSTTDLMSTTDSSVSVVSEECRNLPQLDQIVNGINHKLNEQEDKTDALAELLSTPENELREEFEGVSDRMETMISEAEILTNKTKELERTVQTLNSTITELKNIVDRSTLQLNIQMSNISELDLRAKESELQRNEQETNTAELKQMFQNKIAETEQLRVWLSGLEEGLRKLQSKNSRQDSALKTVQLYRRKNNLDINYTLIMESACNNNDSNIVTALIELKVDIDAPVGPNQVTCLHVAALLNQVDMVKLLIKFGANINTQDSRGWTPLMWTAYKGSLEAAKILVDKRADLSVTSDTSRTVLTYAKYYNMAKLIDFLVSINAPE